MVAVHVAESKDKITPRAMEFCVQLPQRFRSSGESRLSRSSRSSLDSGISFSLMIRYSFSTVASHAVSTVASHSVSTVASHSVSTAGLYSSRTGKASKELQVQGAWKKLEDSGRGVSVFWWHVLTLTPDSLSVLESGFARWGGGTMVDHQGRASLDDLGGGGSLESRV